jgi:hypothetical protein
MRSISRTLTIATTAGALALASAATVAAPAHAAHAETTHAAATLDARTQTPPFAAYHGVSATEHLLQFNALRARGYRPITISISDDIHHNLRYAAVWSTSGAALGGNHPWILHHKLTPREYQRRFDEYTAQGYYPAVVSAVGWGDNTRFAVIFLQRPDLRFVARHGLTSKQFRDLNHELRRKGMVLSSFDVYGELGDRRYIAVWTPNPSGADWKVAVDISLDWHEFEAKGLVTRGYRLTGIAVSATGRYTVVWRKDPGPAWHSVARMTAATYQSHFDELKAKGYYPVHISAEKGRYAAIWTK